jgi:hypothetical protein
MSAQTNNASRRKSRAAAAIRHKQDFGKKSETMMSPRQPRPDGQNPIARKSSRINAAQPWLCAAGRASAFLVAHHRNEHLLSAVYD